MWAIEFTVKGRPVAYVRTTHRQKFINPYYKRSRDYKDYFAYVALQELNKNPGFFCRKGEFLTVEAVAFLRGKRRIDVDNLLKNVMDSLNRIAYEDDYQIRKASIERLSVNNKDDERMEVRLTRG